jgi:hypothetical protein
MGNLLSTFLRYYRINRRILGTGRIVGHDAPLINIHWMLSLDKTAVLEKGSI